MRRMDMEKAKEILLLHHCICEVHIRKCLIIMILFRKIKIIN